MSGRRMPRRAGIAGRVIALGQRSAGDDGVGLAVLDRLRACAPDGIELCAARDAAELVSFLATSRPVVLVDAVIGEPVGAVRELAPEALDGVGRGAMSSHGLSAGQAIALARALDPGGITPRIAIVAVTIATPIDGSDRLSPEAEAAVERAAALALARVR